MREFFNHSGFTLVEVLIGMVIYMTGLVGVTGLTVLIVSNNIRSDRLTTATTLAQNKIEEIKSLGYPHAGGAAGTQIWVDQAWESYTTQTKAQCGGFVKQTGVAYCFIRKTDVGSNVPAGMKTVTVRVYWSSEKYAADDHTVELRTILAP